MEIISTSLLTESELYQLDKRFASISTNDFNKIFEGSIEPTKAQRKDLKKFLTSVPHLRNEIAQRLGSMSLSKDKVERFFELVQPYQMELA